MRTLAHLAMITLMLWSVLGLAGTALALLRRERTRARRGLLTMGGIWAVYLAVLLAVSRAQPERRTAPGAERCFAKVCFSVLRAEQIPGFYARNVEPSLLLRVSVRIRNLGGSRSDGEATLRPYLVDSRGRRWSELPGLSGVRLTAPVAPGGSVISAPVFHTAAEATGLGLVLTHRGFTASRLVIGDPESLGHRPEILLLPTGAGVADAAAWVATP